ncbi:RNA polymerase sigma factor [Laspinema olomoucense]|uniref:RNA polymerase sigma factor n=1 Tax=Laspinema olomoucense TaxID=3231600 RepID=UPI0021BA96AB|nr:sigma-70 family RNA polymerase sigma factor [Laspinema sp. D3a]MCT7989050.1 sigma-70 family RNA polymerase sigma factor [Laspinema sp. D3a]
MVQATTNPIANRAEERELLHRLAAGETRAFWQLFQPCQNYLLRCCLKWTNGNLTEAEDLLSQGMLKAFKKAQKYAETIENFKSWLTTLTRNFWFDLKRRPCANQVEDIEVYAEREEVGLVAVDDTPESALERDDKNRVIRAAIDELPTKMRETYCLHFHEELSPQEIVERQGISSQNVYKRISQARAILAKELRGYFIEEDVTEPDIAKVAATPAKSKKAVQKAAQVEPILPEIVTLSEQLEEEEKTKTELAATPPVTEPTIKEMSERNGGVEPGCRGEAYSLPPGFANGRRIYDSKAEIYNLNASPSHWKLLNRDALVEPILGVPMTLSVAIAQVESVGGEELPFVAVSVQYSESDSVVGNSEGRLYEFSAIGKQIVGAFPPCLHCFGGLQLFHGLVFLSALEIDGFWLEYMLALTYLSCIYIIGYSCEAA